MILGIASTGRHTLTKLSTFIKGYSLYEIQITKGYNENSWKDDIKIVLKYSGS